ncbi:hypothetical protein FVEG_02462 [Fusarium verticillioides 7600]|uniref:Secreted protein n=1 Tax=Gibberella moniliformis (strain M3125 / FGSC 7600) TaxID=334819 RepID=W7LWE4_GIBM7|nr:hypothetical protein FVEG_02462 [Fusarium verticillioides 7600]EWG39744.1 hypothetical protein FVEG_02462 [Fusarium verticillioides 7600]
MKFTKASFSGVTRGFWELLFSLLLILLPHSSTTRNPAAIKSLITLQICLRFCVMRSGTLSSPTSRIP